MRAALVAACAVALAACGAGPDVPEREADAVGIAATVLAEAGEVRVAFTPDPGYEYFEGTEFVLNDEVAVTGAVASAQEIAEGDRLMVWTGACAESFPVQCSVEAVEVLDLAP